MGPPPANLYCPFLGEDGACTITAAQFKWSSLGWCWCSPQLDQQQATSFWIDENHIPMCSAQAQMHTHTYTQQLHTPKCQDHFWACCMHMLAAHCQSYPKFRLVWFKLFRFIRFYSFRFVSFCSKRFVWSGSNCFVSFASIIFSFRFVQIVYFLLQRSPSLQF